jgi:hypothetical protein
MLFTKRFCLPSNSDIKQYENGEKKVNSCLCGHYNHISCLFQSNWCFDKNKLKILSLGVNSMGDSLGIKPGIHAEYDAIRKLPPLKRKKRLENINILVIRLSGKNKLQQSKPCYNCIKTMRILPIKLGYSIKNVYYSDNNGKILKTTLRELESEEAHYSRFYKRMINC